MKNLDSLIGLPLDMVEGILKKENIEYQVVQNSSIQKPYDTIIVIKITTISETKVELVTDKFLINIQWVKNEHFFQKKQEQN